MAKVSGFEVCRRLRADPDLATTPIITIMTAMLDPAWKEKGLEAGADLAIPKPFDPNADHDDSQQRAGPGIQAVARDPVNCRTAPAPGTGSAVARC